MKKKRKQEEALSNIRKTALFIKDVQAIENEHGLHIQADDVNPHQLAIVDEKDKIIAWLGTNKVKFLTDYIDVMED